MNVVARMITQEQDGIPGTLRIPRAPASDPAS